MQYYLRIYALLYKQEQSLDEIASGLNKNASRIRYVVARMRASDLVCISSYEKKGRSITAKFKVGSVDAVLENGKHKSQNKSSKKCPTIIAMKSIIDFLSTDIGHSTQEISEHTGIGRHAINRFIRDAMELGIIHIDHWDRSVTNNNWVAHYQWGIGKSAKRPKPKPRRQVNIDYNRSAKFKMFTNKSQLVNSIFNYAQLKAA